MTDKLRVLYYALWILHPLFQIGITAVMLRRGLVSQFKFFFAYILTQLLTFGIIFPAYVWRSYSAVFYLYWVCTAVSSAFGFLVIHEVFVDVFRLFHTLRDLGSVLFKWAGLVMLLVAGVVSVSTNSNEMAPWMQAIVTTQRCVRIVQVGMVLFLLFFAHYVGVSRRQHSFGIALGFGSFATIELALISSWIGQHLHGSWPSIVNMMAYNGSLILWTYYLAAKLPARGMAPSLLKPQRWEQSLSEMHNPVAPDSLIPMFEGMVDRALSRTRPEVAVGQPAAVPVTPEKPVGRFATAVGSTLKK